MKILSKPVAGSCDSISTSPNSCHKLAMAILSIFLGLGVTVVSAQGPMSQADQPVLTALDLNADGMLSTEEVQSSPESLRALDQNGDGVLSPEETRLVLPDGRPFPPMVIKPLMPMKSKTHPVP